MGLFGKGESQDRVQHSPGDLVAFYWNGSVPIAHPVSEMTAEGFYMNTRDRWHLGTLLTVTLQKRQRGPVSAVPAHLVVLVRVTRQDAAGAFLDFVPVLGQRQGTAVRPASKKEIAQFLRAFGAGL